MTTGTLRGDLLDTSRRERSESLDAVHYLEKIASSPGVGRLDEWRTELRDALSKLNSQLQDQYKTSADEDSVLGSVIDESPHLASRVRNLRNRQQRLLERIEALDLYVADSSRTVDMAGLRGEVRDLVNEVQALRAEESDLVYEAFYVDLGVGD